MRRPSISNTSWRMAVAATAVALALLSTAGPAAAAGGPKLVKDINPTGSSFPANLTQVGNKVFFAANDGVHGVELWKSNGTAAGTKMVKNIRPYGKSSNPQDLVNVNGTLFFTAVDGQHGRELWKSDGTKAGTVMVKDIHTGPKDQFGGNSTNIHERIFEIGGRLFFFADGVGTQLLYVSDGTAAGTYYLDQDRDFQLPDEGSLGTAGGRLYFVNGHWDGEHFGYQMWVTDGTAPGTHKVAGSPRAENMSILPNNGTKLYFYAGHRLWRTDGTKAGTKALTSSGELLVAPTESVLMGKALYFGESGMGGALWKTNGTPKGTKEISGGAVADLVSAGGRVYWSSHGYLEVSDGTGAGTRDLALVGTWPLPLVAVSGKVCFVAQDYEAGTAQLWVSNGTTPGTHPIASFVSSAATEQPGAAVGNKFFFTADDGVHGVELWRYTP